MLVFRCCIKSCNYLCQGTWWQGEEEQDSQGEECKGSQVMIKPFFHDNDGNYGDGRTTEDATCWTGRLQRTLQRSVMLSWGANTVMKSNSECNL